MYIHMYVFIANTNSRHLAWFALSPLILKYSGTSTYEQIFLKFFDSTYERIFDLRKKILKNCNVDEYFLKIQDNI